MSPERHSPEAFRSSDELFQRIVVHCIVHGKDISQVDHRRPRTAVLDVQSILQYDGDPIQLTYTWPLHDETTGDKLGHYLAIDFPEDEQGVGRQLTLYLDEDGTIGSSVDIIAPDLPARRVTDDEQIEEMLLMRLALDQPASFDDFLTLDSILHRLDQHFGRPLEK